MSRPWTLMNWVWITRRGDVFALDFDDFVEAGIDPDRRTPRLNYAILWDFMELYAADWPE